MKKSFPGYYPQDEGSRNAIWNRATFVFDTCSLLNLYSYSDKTREEILSVLDNVKQRIWIPYHVGLEYHRNRTNRITQECKNFESQIKAFKEFLEAVEHAQRSKRQHPFISEEKLKSLKSSVDAVNTDLQDGLKSLESHVTNDPILNHLTLLFEDKVGEQFTRAELQEIYKEGRQRYKHDVPPGYADDQEKGGDKGDPEKFGDLVLWKEILRYAKAKACPIVFVTDDEKEDWWRKTRGRRIGARAELLAEFTAETKQQCLLYGSESFLFEADKIIGNLPTEVVEEVQSVAQARRHMAAAMQQQLAAIAAQTFFVDSIRRNELVKNSFPDSVRRMIEKDASLRSAMLQTPLPIELIQPVMRGLYEPADSMRRAIESLQRATKNPLEGIDLNALRMLKDYSGILDAMRKSSTSDNPEDTYEVTDDEMKSSTDSIDGEDPGPSGDKEDDSGESRDE